jgi:hypothetical protein
VGDPGRSAFPIDGRTPSVEQIEAQIAKLRLNANGIEAIEALFAQLRGCTALRS